MGMFDTVVVECPRCGVRVEFQSRGGDGRLREYVLGNAPTEVVTWTHAEVCTNCKRVWKLVLVATIQEVSTPGQLPSESGVEHQESFTKRRERAAQRLQRQVLNTTVAEGAD